MGKITPKGFPNVESDRDASIQEAIGPNQTWGRWTSGNGNSEWVRPAISEFEEKLLGGSYEVGNSYDDQGKTGFQRGFDFRRRGRLFFSSDGKTNKHPNDNLRGNHVPTPYWKC